MRCCEELCVNSHLHQSEDSLHRSGRHYDLCEEESSFWFLCVILNKISLRIKLSYTKYYIQNSSCLFLHHLIFNHVTKTWSTNCQVCCLVWYKACQITFLFLFQTFKTSVSSFIWEPWMKLTWHFLHVWQRSSPEVCPVHRGPARCLQAWCRIYELEEDEQILENIQCGITFINWLL